MAARMPMIETTIISSIRVKPAWFLLTSLLIMRLPVLVFRTVNGRIFALGIDVIDVIPAPHGTVRAIRIGTKPPLRRAILHHRVERIDGNSAQEFFLCAINIAKVGPFDQLYQGRRAR